jgi:AhpD family alkylhydroperoxidase
MQRIARASADHDPELRDVFREIERTRGHVSAVMQTLGHSPAALRRYAELGEYVRYKAALPARTRELMILAIAQGNQYAWAHHVKPAQRAGVTPAELRSLAEGRTPQEVGAAERAAIDYARQFRNGGQVSDAVFAAMRREWTDAQIVEASLLAGYYLVLGSVITAFQLDLEPEYEPYADGGPARGSNA